MEKIYNKFLRRNPEYKPSSLERIAARLIAKNIKHFIEPIRSEQTIDRKSFALRRLAANLNPGQAAPSVCNAINPINQLPPTCRQRVTEEMMMLKRENCKDRAFSRTILKALPHLLSPSTKEFQSFPDAYYYEGQLRKCPDKNFERKFYREMLKLLSKFAPNIRCMDIGGYLRHSGIVFQFEVDGRMARSISQMKFLSHLTLTECSIHFEELAQICKCCENLIYVDVRQLWEDWKITTEQIRTHLHRLRVFAFCIPLTYRLDEDLEFSQYFTEMCLKGLEKIEIIGNKATSHGVYINLEKETITKPCNLRHMILYPKGPTGFDQCNMFPEITHLRINWRHFMMNIGREPDTIPTFLRLRYLFISWFPARFFSRILETSGKNLRTLIIESGGRFGITIRLSTIFFNCPNLKHLNIFANFVCMLDEALYNISRLDYLRLRVCDGVTPHKIYLSRILSAPLLEEVIILTHDVDLQDLRRLITLVSMQKVLTKVKAFNLRISQDASPNGETSIALFELKEIVQTNVIKNKQNN